MKIYLVLLTLTFVCVTSVAADCGGDLSGDNGTFVYPPEDPGVNKTCTWKITSKTSVVMVHLSTLTITGGDKVAAYVGVGTEKPIKIFTDSNGPVTVVSPTNIMTVVLTRGTSATTTTKFSADYNTKECAVSMTGLEGALTNPLYPVGTGKLQCTFTVTLAITTDTAILSFTKFNLPNGFVVVTFDSASPLNFTGPNVPADSFGIVGTKTISVKYSVDNATTLQEFSALYFTADPGCSKQYKTSDPFVLPATNQLPLTCYAQISAPATKFVTVSIDKAVDDSIEFLDGNNILSPPIGSVIQDGLSHWFVSSGDSMTLRATLNPTHVARTTAVALSSSTNSRLYKVATTPKKVTLNAKDAVSPVLIEFVADPSKKLTIIFDKITLTDGTILVQDRSDFNFAFGKTSAFFPVTVPSNHLLLTVTFSGNQSVSTTVTATDGASCNSIISGGSGPISWARPPAGEEVCTQVIKPSKVGNGKVTVTDMIVDIGTLTMCPASTIDVYEGLTIVSKLATFTGSQSAGPLILFPSNEGARFVYTIKNCTKLQVSPIMVGSYWIQDHDMACSKFLNSPSSFVTSNFPNKYPLNYQCQRPITATKNSTTLYISFSNFNVNPAHTLTAKQTVGNTTTTVMSVTGPSLPRDYLLGNKELVLDFTATAMMVNGSYVVPGYGVSASVKVLTCGGYVNKDGSIASPAPQADSTECIWLIDLPPPSIKSSVNIVSAKLNVTGYKAKSSDYLQLRDGDSVRAPLMKLDFTKAIPPILSRTNHLWLVYKVTKPANDAAVAPLKFNLEFTTFTCNKSSQCDNGICMHADWRCDNINQCGDGSDEFHCNGTMPTPAPGKAGKKSGVAGFWLPICIILGLIVGVVVTVYVPRIIRKRRQKKYGSMVEGLTVDT